MPNGTTFVVTSNKVSRFDPSGASVSSFGTAGSGQLQFAGGSGIALGPDGNLEIVALGGNHTISGGAGNDLI
jgi:DNA-binding beta-propeller fold protein YncE